MIRIIVLTVGTQYTHSRASVMIKILFLEKLLAENRVERYTR